MRARSGLLLAWIAALPLAAACASLAGLSGGSGDAGAGDTSVGGGDAPPERTSDAFAPETGSDVLTGVDVADASIAEVSILDAPAEAAPCPGTALPVAARAGAFCIDTTEVTNAQYAAFLATGAPPAK